MGYGNTAHPSAESVKKKSINDFTITGEIHARSLANFYCQYVSEREPAVGQFVIVKNNLMSVLNAFVLLLIMNFVITLSK